MPVINLHHNNAPKESYYILDSTVWLPILGLDNEPASEHYKIFFDKILKHSVAKILLCPLQLSEILNRLLRFHARIAYDKKYKSKNGYCPTFVEFYKREYRETEDFRLKYLSILDDLEGYSTHILFDDLLIKDFKQLTSFNPCKLDFNDHYLYLFAKERTASIITHDADFFGLDIDVGTYNTKLYKEYKNSIRPK